MFDISPFPTLYKNFSHQTVGWDEALNHLDVLEKDNGIRDKTVVFRHSHGFISYRGERLTPVQPFLKILEDKVRNTDHPVATAHLYGGLTSSSKTTERHHDLCHVWFWQCKGKTKWIVDGEKFDPITFILEEGDMLYVPPKFNHEVIPMSPRLGISFGAEKS
jgi:mannose-6-phosphate isomerase-like protein (cupin superfamily)